jgi:hypothetical protein
MTITSCKQYWREDYSQNLEYFENAVDPFRGWEDRRGYGSWASWFLNNALAAAYSDAPAPIVEKFAQAAIGIVDRAFNEDRICSESNFPLGRGDALLTRAYAKMLLGYSLNFSDLSAAAHDYYDYIMADTWNSMYEAHFLSALRMACIANDKSHLAVLVRTKKRFRFNDAEFQALKEFAHALLREERTFEPQLMHDLEHVFNLYRDPNYKHEQYFEADIGRFEHGIIYCNYLSHGKSNIRTVIDCISR